ncbi:MAG: NADH-quinone oxidoreductase subunit M [Planctomycetota bacterium]|nr:NADH-quinone oxidoreductase subunit M [Planctomycetota bacterium]
MVSWCTFLPLLTAVVVAFLPGRNKLLVKSVALAGAIITLIIAIGLITSFDSPGNQRLDDFCVEKKEELLKPLSDERRGRVTAALQFLENRTADSADKGVYDLTVKGLQDAGLYTLFTEVRDLEYAAQALTAKHIRSVEYYRWIPTFGIHYFMGIDGLSLPLVALTALLGVICLVYSWNIEKATKGYFALFLLLETGLIGVFCALDFFLFYVFWEIVLLPMYFLIGIWGGPRRIYASIKFFIYTLVGSVFMLIAMLALYFQLEPHTFNFFTLITLIPDTPLSFQMWIFAFLFIGFAIKVPIWPFHTWLPDAHVEAPTAVSVILAGVLLKMGAYGFFRISFPMMPAAAMSTTFVTLFVALGLINMIYGALCAMAQKDFKSLVAYSSISHMGYVLLGLVAITNAGVQGAALQMFNHGVSSAMLFLIVGVVYERAHHRNLGEFGGLGLQMPYYTAIAMVGFFASLGLPGLNGFISEVFVFLGAYQAPTFDKWVVFAAIPTVVLTAAYILWTIQRVFFGPIRQEKYKSFPDLSGREWFCLVPLAVLCIVVGIFPMTVLGYMDESLNAIVEICRPHVR